MAERLSWVLQARISGGPQMRVVQQVEIEAYDKLTFEIPKKEGSTAGEATVLIQPGTSQQVRFLLITASAYVQDLTYNSGDQAIVLDAPQLFSGAGAVGLLEQAPNTLKFSNSSDKPVTIEILVGRAATS